MITFTSAQLNTWLIAFLWPFTRILGLLASAPVTSGPQFPAMLLELQVDTHLATLDRSVRR